MSRRRTWSMEVGHPSARSLLYPTDPLAADFRQSWVWEARYIRSTTQALADQDATTYFCINFPKVLQKRISDAIHSLTALAKNPLFLDTLIIDEVIAFYRDAIKRHRAQLLSLVSLLSHKSVPRLWPPPDPHRSF